METENIKIIIGLVIIIWMIIFVIKSTKNIKKHIEYLNEPDVIKEIDLQSISFDNEIRGGIIGVVFSIIFTLILLYFIGGFIYLDGTEFKSVTIIFLLIGASLIIRSIYGVASLIKSDKMLKNGDYIIQERKLINKFIGSKGRSNLPEYTYIFENFRKPLHGSQKEYERSEINDIFYIVTIGSNYIAYNSKFYKLKEEDISKLV